MSGHGRSCPALSRPVMDLAAFSRLTGLTGLTDNSTDNHTQPHRLAVGWPPAGRLLVVCWSLANIAERVPPRSTAFHRHKSHGRWAPAGRWLVVYLHRLARTRTDSHGLARTLLALARGTPTRYLHTNYTLITHSQLAWSLATDRNAFATASRCCGNCCVALRCNSRDD